MMVIGIKRCCTSDKMDGRIRKELGMLGVKMRQDGNCVAIEAER
jgi:hypothetical protein